MLGIRKRCRRTTNQGRASGPSHRDQRRSSRYQHFYEAALRFVVRARGALRAKFIPMRYASRSRCIHNPTQEDHRYKRHFFAHPSESYKPSYCHFRRPVLRGYRPTVPTVAIRCLRSQSGPLRRALDDGSSDTPLVARLFISWSCSVGFNAFQKPSGKSAAVASAVSAGVSMQGNVPFPSRCLDA